MEIPGKRTTKVVLDTADAEAKLRAWNAQLSATGRFYQQPRAPLLPNMSPMVKHADGGTVAGPRFPYGDKVLIAAAPGEEIISNRHGEADRFRADRAAGRIPKYAGAFADGGTVGGFAVPAGLDVMGLGPSKMQKALEKELRKQEKALKRLNDALTESRRAVDEEKRARQDLVKERDQFAASISGAHTTGLFGNASMDVWLSGGDRAASAVGSVFGALTGDIAAGKSLLASQKELAGKGVTGDAFTALVSQARDANDLAAVAGMSQADVDRYMSLYGERDKILTSVGAYAGQHVYGDAVKAQTAVLQETRAQAQVQAAETKALRKEVNQLSKIVDKVGRQVATAVKSSPPKGTKR